MQPGRPTPAEIIGELLTNHPEAASLLGHASHYRALASCSGVTTRLRFAAAQGARLAYEELRHRLEPRGRHGVHFGVGLLLMSVLSAGLALLDLIEFGGSRSVMPALAATAVWVTIAWLGAVTVRQQRWAMMVGIGAAGVLLGLLLVALHGLGPHSGHPAIGGDCNGGMILGALTGIFILVLTLGVGALAAHLESANLLLARRRWYLAQTAHEEAVETERTDVEAAAVAIEAWLSLVRVQVTAIAADDERLLQATVAFAAVLAESGRAQLPPSL